MESDNERTSCWIAEQRVVRSPDVEKGARRKQFEDTLKLINDMKGRNLRLFLFTHTHTRERACIRTLIISPDLSQSRLQDSNIESFD